MNPRINGRPSSFRHYRLTLQLALSPSLFLSLSLSLSLSLRMYLDTLSRTLVLYIGHPFHVPQVSICREFNANRRQDERIDRGLFAESLRAEPQRRPHPPLSKYAM